MHADGENVWTGPEVCSLEWEAGVPQVIGSEMGGIDVP